MSFASISGWIAAALVACALLVPALHRALRGRRAVVGSRPVSAHVALGLSVGAVSLVHPLGAILALGSPGAIGGGELALGFGGLAFVLLLAHTGLGLKLRDPTLRKRAQVRRNHLATALVIVAAVVGHVVWLARGRAG